MVHLLLVKSMLGAYSGTNRLKLTNIFQSTSSLGTSTPAFSISDTYSNTSLMFLPNSGSSVYK